MTDAEWQSLSNPEHLYVRLFPLISARRLRLYSAGSFRYFADREANSLLIAAVEIAERYADGQEGIEGLARSAESVRLELERLRFWALRSLEESRGKNRHFVLEAHGRLAIAELAGKATADDPDGSATDFQPVEFANSFEARSNELLFQAHRRLLSELRDLSCCVFDGIFHPIVFDPRWQSADVFDLAQAIYADRAFDRMPILADALMDAGCDSDDIIQHCRGPGPHVRGCWVVDLILGKE